MLAFESHATNHSASQPSRFVALDRQGKESAHPPHHAHERDDLAADRRDSRRHREGYSEQTGEAANLSSKVDRYLGLLRLPDADVNVLPLLNKDSLEMTDQDRSFLLGMVRVILKEQVPIVITHGTDTMVESGLYLQRALPELEVPIVMTGP
jgi:hypothetical protein